MSWLPICCSYNYMMASDQSPSYSRCSAHTQTVDLQLWIARWQDLLMLLIMKHRSSPICTKVMTLEPKEASIDIYWRNCLHLRLACVHLQPIEQRVTEDNSSPSNPRDKIHYSFRSNLSDKEDISIRWLKSQLYMVEIAWPSLLWGDR